jgi:hypothetical protein
MNSTAAIVSVVLCFNTTLFLALGTYLLRNRQPPGPR